MTAPIEVDVTTSPVEVTVTAEPPVEVTTALTGTFVESGGGTPEDLDYSSSPDIGEALADDDEFPVSNTSSGSSVVSALSRVWTYVLSKMPFASQAEMEAGTETSTRSMSPERVKQAIDALSSGGDLVDDSTPQLGGDLDLVTHSIVTTSNRDITLTPNGTGNIVLGTVTLDADQTVGVGQDNFVLTYDNATGLLSLEEAAAGGGDYEDGGEAGGADRTLGNTDSFDLGFLTDNATRLHIQSDGNVGIGTASPTAPLDVTSTSDQIRASYDASNYMVLSADKFGRGRLDSAGTLGGRIGVGKDPSYQFDVSGTINAGGYRLNAANLFVAAGSGLVIWTHLRIDSSGTAGIGTNAPKNSWDVNGGQVIGSSYAGIETAPTDGLLVEGNVGIGTTAPDTLLDINGAVTQRPLSADPADPDDGNSVQWISDGTGSGDAGDVMMKITVGATTKTITVADFSAA